MGSRLTGSPEARSGFSLEDLGSREFGCRVRWRWCAGRGFWSSWIGVLILYEVVSVR
jgi:hypothetical protein